MRLQRERRKQFVLGSILVFGLPFSFHFANAAQDSAADAGASAGNGGVVILDRRDRTEHQREGGEGSVVSKGGFGTRTAARSYGAKLQCVPFARTVSGIVIRGNAVNWWNAAKGVYERGRRPETGSVLNFRATGNMRLGHVAVVTRVVNPREIIVDHANWNSYGNPGNISRNVAVVDVSSRNDWSLVRVELDHSDEFGSIYPTYGFIYDRPDRGVMVANDLAGTGRSIPDIRIGGYEEVAEAPLHARNVPNTISFVDAPYRNIR
jgi:surface antigen